MDSHANNLYETASQPDEGNDAYTFLKFHTQGEEDFTYPVSQPIRSSSTLCPAPSDSIAAADAAFSTESSTTNKLRGGINNSNNNNRAASGSGNNGSKEREAGVVL